VRDGLTLSKLRAEHPTLTLIDLIYVKKKHEKLTLACKGDTLLALLVWFHHNLAGFSNSNNDFCCFLSVITPIMMALNTLLETG
jgi:ethanolamine utilization cobalamin adenosyltransferase